MRVVIIFVVLIALAFIGYQAWERYRPEAPVETVQPDADASGAPAPDAAPPEAAPSLPSFDIVRVDRTGYAVIAGRAKPGAEVTVSANDQTLARSETQPDGSWVITTETPLDAGPVELGLSMTTADGQTIRSEETIVIYVPEREGDRPLVLRTTPGGATEVLQETRDPEGGLGPLSLDAIDYDDSGAVIFSGKAEPDRVVQIFINRQFLDQATATPDGAWTIMPGQSIAPGVYTLHVVQLDAEGRPAYAIEVPFERARPEDVDLSNGRVVVQPGNSLWRIARQAYGEGAQYTIIYEANAASIRDPDLIYPGQIFNVPGSEDESEGDDTP